MKIKELYSKYKYYVALITFLLIGIIIIQSLLNTYYSNSKKRFKKELQISHNSTVLHIETGINVYSTVVSSIRSHIQNSSKFPSDIDLKNYLNDLIKEIDFKDSIVVSFVDTNQIFQYSVTPHQIDPFNLKGLDVKKLRPKAEVDKLNKLMHKNHISLFAPINLREGWAAFPFNFSARDNKNNVLGYIAPVLNVKYLLDYTYKNQEESIFAHCFIVEDSFDISRETVFDGTKIYNQNKDKEYYKNFNIKTADFVYSNISFYGLNLKIGTAYKKTPSISHFVSYITYLWYGIICVFSFITLRQSLKNKLLNQKMRQANIEILHKNKALNDNFKNIQILLKEVHHRVKNNMQIISSLLNLQRNGQEDKDVIKALDTSKSRIQSMALVHQKLYGSENLSNVNVESYVNQLAVYIENTLEGIENIPEKTITINNDIELNMDTMVPLGLILNELLTNSYKYAFNSKQNGKLLISISQSNTIFTLTYSDNGSGIPDQTNIENSGTLGLELIHILTDQLKGSVSYCKKELSTFTITFNEIKN